MTNNAVPELAKRKPSFAEWLRRLGSDLLRDKWLYLLMLPGVVYFIIFKYAPIYGLKIAFQDYNPFDPASSPWIGFGQFQKLFSNQNFLLVIRNTLVISISRLVTSFPAPIILALLMNELRSIRYKRTVQTILYLPHFISWVIMSGMVIAFVNPSNGLINQLIEFMGGTKVDFLNSSSLFIPTLIISGIYKEMGWGTIVYFAAISAVEEEQYEAAIIDGAGRLAQAIYITLPSIKSTIVVLLILQMGSILNAGFEQVFLLYSPLVYDIADIIDTYVYRKGIVEASYSFSAAAGMFKSVVALVLISGSNYVARRLGESGVF